MSETRDMEGEREKGRQGMKQKVRDETQRSDLRHTEGEEATSTDT